MADFIYRLPEFRLYVFSLLVVYCSVVLLYYAIELIMLVLQFTIGSPSRISQLGSQQ
jgi:hypothetical protein